MKSPNFTEILNTANIPLSKRTVFIEWSSSLEQMGTQLLIHQQSSFPPYRVQALSSLRKTLGLVVHPVILFEQEQSCFSVLDSSSNIQVFV